MYHLFMTLIHPRHFWRRIKMTELSELYVSMTLKSLALSLIAIFIPVFLFQEGFSIVEIGLFYAFYFTARVPLDLLGGYLTARFGPKHLLSYSYVLLVVFLGLLLTLPDYGWPLWLVAVSKALFNSFFFVAYHVDFSKVHSIEKGGSELSLMNILVRIAAAAGPFIGGLVATVFSINITIVLALSLVLLAIWPLMLSAEPLKKQKRLELESFSLRANAGNLLSYVWLGISRQVSLTIWPLYISVFIFVDDVYAKVGLVTSVSIAASLLVARLYGKLIDRRGGGTLLRASSVFSAVIHLLRPGVGGLGGVSLVNLTSEIAETGVILPYTKGFYDEADSAKNRIAYIAVMESSIAAARALFWLGLVFFALSAGEKTALIASFFVAAACSLLVIKQNYRALRA